MLLIAMDKASEEKRLTQNNIDGIWTRHPTAIPTIVFFKILKTAAPALWFLTKQTVFNFLFLKYPRMI